MTGDIVYGYSRAQAIEDGTLVDVSMVAKEAGITYPVALTRALWTAFVELPDDYQGCQDESGRLWDVLWMTRAAIMRTRGAAEIVYPTMRLRRIRPNGRDYRRLDTVHFKSVCGPGDDAAPVITIMLSEED